MKRDPVRGLCAGVLVSIAGAVSACGPMNNGGFDASHADHAVADARDDVQVHDVPSTDVPVVDAPVVDVPSTDVPVGEDTPTADAPVADAAADAGMDVATGDDVVDASSADAASDVAVDARADVVGVDIVSVGDGGTTTYTPSTIAGACDDMSGATSLMVTMDDHISAVQPLPFAFTFFGAPQMFYAAASSGYIQFVPSMTTPVTSEPFNETIPMADAPNNYVAPFWDYLDIPADGGNDVVAKTFGASTTAQHLTVQWTHWAYLLDEAERVTFQAKLFEGTNAIEFHYCVLMPGTSPAYASGSSATVGIENATGTAGTLISYDHAGAVTTANAYRLTPSP